MPDPLSAPSGPIYRGFPLTPSPYILGFPGDEEDGFGPLSSDSFMAPTQSTGKTLLKGVHPRSTVCVVLMPSSLVTDTHAISIQSATRVILNTPQQHLQCSATITNAVASTKSHQAPSNNDLPTGSVHAFTVHFIPILQKYIGSLENPCVTKRLANPMQMIWDGVMQDWPHKFAEDNDKVYCLVSDYLPSPPTAILIPLYLIL